MNKTLVFASLLGLGLAASPGVMAKPDKHYDRGGERGHDNRHDRRDDRRDDRREHRQDHRRDDRRDDYRRSHWQHEREHYWQGDRYRVGIYHVPRGYQRHHWRHGDHLPVVYRSSRYVVSDYHAYHLYAPPRHHHWVRVDNDVVLTAIATGVVAAVVYNIFQ